MRVRRVRPVFLFALAVVVVASCRDGAGPTGTLTGHFALAPSFASAAAGIVDIAQVRVRLFRADESLALDETVTVPAGADSLALELTVTLNEPNEVFQMVLDFITAAGDTVFRAGPVEVTASSASTEPVPVEVDAVYVGAGANAASVVITTPPGAVQPGQTVRLSAEARDDQDQPIPGTPIEWISLDLARATVPDAAVGDVVGGMERGVARVVARLLTGQADTVDVFVLVPLANSVTDPTGDTFETTASDGLVVPDIVQLGAEVENTDLVIQIDFAQPMVSNLTGGDNVVVGFVDIDVDQDSMTGYPSQVDGFRPDTGSTGTGVEYYVSLFVVDSLGQVPVFDYMGEMIPDSITPVFSGTTLIMRVPLAALGGDDGSVNIATVLGTIPEPTDIAPNYGHLASGTSGGVSPQTAVRRGAPVAARARGWPSRAKRGNRP